MNAPEVSVAGATGFVGSTLANQVAVKHGYSSKTIAEAHTTPHDCFICAAAPAQKWIANQDPAADRAKIEGLIAHLAKLEVKQFVLVSTVDVFKQPLNVDEHTPVDTTGLHAYGANRRLLEEFVEAHFKRHLIIRLPGLVGPGLRKNIIYDFRHHNNLSAIDHRGVFQFYPMVNLWGDIQQALAAGLSLVHLTAEPVRVQEVAELGFGMRHQQTLSHPPASYDMRTRHAAVFGGQGHYQYSARESLTAIRAYAQSEPAAR